MTREVIKGSPEWSTLSMALDRVPIHFQGIHVQAKLYKAFETPLEGVYQVFIGYGEIALQGVMFMHEPAMMLYLDYTSMLAIVQACIQAAIQHYNATSSPFYRGM